MPIRRGGGEVGAARVFVQQAALLGGLEQGVVGVLAVDVHQEFAGFLELLGCGGPAVDEGPGTAAGFHHPAQQQDAVVAGQVVLLQPGVQAGHLVGGELGGHFGPRRAFPHHPRVGPLPQYQGQGAQQDGLAGAGLAGQRGKTGLELQVQALHQDEVGDGQAQQHG